VSGELVIAASATITAPEAPLSAAAWEAVKAGMPASTRRAYDDNVRWYREWCEDVGRPGLPASRDDLTEYATYVAYTLGWAPASIERARWAILKWHDFAAAPAPSTSGLVLVLKGYREALATANHPKARTVKATAAGRSTLAAMLAKTDRSKPAGCRDAAMLLIGFAFGGRRSEIASLDIGQSFEFRPEGVQVKVYRRKIRKMDDPVVKYQPTADLCPVRALEAWLAMLAAAGRTSGPVFIRVDQHGNFAPPITRNGVPIGDPSGRMTGQAVAQVIKRRALAAGLKGKWSGHSVRRGLATALHEAKKTRRTIERQGGWGADSKAVAGYIDDADRWLDDVLEGVL